MRNCVIHHLEPLDFSGNEALNSICTNLSFVGRDMKKFAISSCTQNEGKSSMSMQIMANLARRGKRVVLVDSDLRKSVMMAHFGITMDGSEVIGRDVMNPLPLLDSKYFAQMLDELARRFDMVLVDTPPIGVVIDAAVVAKSCDGAVLVIEYAKRRKAEIADAVQKIEQSGSPVIGCIINRVSVKTLSERNYYKNHYYGYGTYGEYGYGNEEEKKK